MRCVGNSCNICLVGFFGSEFCLHWLIFGSFCEFLKDLVTLVRNSCIKTIRENLTYYLLIYKILGVLFHVELLWYYFCSSFFLTRTLTFIDVCIKQRCVCHFTHLPKSRIADPRRFMKSGADQKFAIYPLAERNQQLFCDSELCLRNQRMFHVQLFTPISTFLSYSYIVNNVSLK